VSPDAPYVLRVALSSLYRPQNRTVFLVVTLGAGVFLVHLLAVARQSLIEELRIRDSGESPNVVMIDIQPDQRAGLSAHLAASGFPVRDELPIVTMRLASIRGIPLSQWNEESDGHLSGWVPGWEFRVTHRGVLLDNERLTAGEWTPATTAARRFPSPLPPACSTTSGERGRRARLGRAGRAGRVLRRRVRDVDWDCRPHELRHRLSRRWIEDAPATYAATTRASDRRDVQRLQALMRGRFGNVSLIDLSLVFETLTKVMGQAELVVRFLAGFTIATGLLVLVAAVLTSRYQRRRESALREHGRADARLTAVGIESR
jgi:putative ABC transport system permease protein